MKKYIPNRSVFTFSPSCLWRDLKKWWQSQILAQSQRKISFLHKRKWIFIQKISRLTYVQIFKSMALPTYCLSSQGLSGFIMSDYWSSVFPTPSIDHISSSSLPTQSLNYFDKIFQNIFASTKNCRKSNHQNLLFSQENSKLSPKTFLMFPDI